MHKTPLYKWIILLLIPLLGIALIVYRRLSYKPPISHHYQGHGEVVPVEQETEKQTPEVALPEPTIEDKPVEETKTQEKNEEQPAFSPEELEKKETPQPVKEIKTPVKTKKPKNLHEKKESIRRQGYGGQGKQKAKAAAATKPAPKKKIKENEEEDPAFAKPFDKLRTKGAKESGVYPEQSEGADIEQSSRKPTSGLQEISLSDELTKTSFGYKHWSGRYYPSKFVLKFNDEVVLTFDGKEITHVKDKISINPDKPLKAHFDFEFLGGRRLGWKEVMYQIDKNANSVNIDFDWKDPQDYQIILSPAKPLSTKGGNNHDGK